MATTIATAQTPFHPATQPVASPVDLSSALGFAIATLLPVGLFGLVSIGAEALGIVPYFFSPLGLIGWLGAALHLALLPLLGASLFFVARERETRPAIWLGALIAGLILFPFTIGPLDSLQLGMASTGLLLLTMATMVRVSAVSRPAAYLLTPALLWLGISATLGLALAAAWAPPFALTQVHDAPPAA